VPSSTQIPKTRSIGYTVFPVRGLFEKEEWERRVRQVVRTKYRNACWNIRSMFAHTFAVGNF
jgi:hypothetical protein